tara:strand:- start:623 stop:2314 length:1692 start_codon:yes stop_codon:yes gene_type:complete
MSDLKSFSVEMVKIAAEDASESYASRMVGTLPLAIKKGLLADVPKGAVDKAVDLTIRTGKVPSPSKLVGRAVGRGAGAIGAGIPATPMFLQGMKDLYKAETKKEQNIAGAKILGAGFAYSAIKGAIETASEKGLSGTKPKDLLRAVKNVGGVRGLIGMGSAALTAKSVVKNRRQQGKEEKSKRRAVRDAVSGAALGAGKGALDELADKGLKNIKTPKALRGVAARAGGRAAAGMIGAVALGKMFDSYMKKTSSENSTPGFIPTPSTIYTDTRSKSSEMATQDVYAAYSAHIANGEPEGSPAKRAVMYALTDTLRERGQPVKEEQQRESVTPLVRPAAMSAGMIAAAITPAALVALTDRIPIKGDNALKSAIEAQAAQKGLEIIKEDPDSLWGAYGGRFDLDSGKIIVGGKATAETVAHEVGHATAGKLRKALLQNPLVTVHGFEAAQAALALLPLVAIANARDESFATREELEDNKKILDLTRAVGITASVPRLVEEAAASAKATGYVAKALMGQGQSPISAAAEAVARSTRRLGPAFLTYLSPILFAGAASRHLGRALEEKQ